MSSKYDLDKIIETLNDRNYRQKSIDWLEDINDEDYDKYFSVNDRPKTPIRSSLDVDSRRHYETATQVFDFDGKYLGVRAIQMVYSESARVEDCYHKLEFFEMEPITTITYKKIKQNGV